MKVYRSTAPISEDLKAALAGESGRRTFLEFITKRAAGADTTFKLQLEGNKVLEVSAEPVEPEQHAKSNAA